MEAMLLCFISASVIYCHLPKLLQASYGFDGISTILLKQCKQAIVKPLQIIINQALTTGIFPDKLKIAIVQPIYKNEDQTLIKNYRPISLLPAISKVFEKIIFNQLYSFLQKTQYNLQKPIRLQEGAVN